MRAPVAYIIRHLDGSWCYLTIRSDRTVHYESGTARIPSYPRESAASYLVNARRMGSLIRRRSA